jgi:hypothetical protein
MSNLGPAEILLILIVAGFCIGAVAAVAALILALVRRRN